MPKPPRKQIPLKPKPAAKRPARRVDEDTWVRGGNRKTKRFTINLDERLHRGLRMACIDADKTMTEVISELIEREFKGYMR